MKMFDGKRLMTARKQRGWGRTELAKAMTANGADITYMTVLNHEENNTHPGFNEVAIAAQLLGVPIDFFLAEKHTIRKRNKKKQSSTTPIIAPAPKKISGATHE